MLTRIEVSDLFLENTRSTAEAEINLPAPLKVWFFCGGTMTSGYIDFKEESRHVVRYMNDEDYPAFNLVPESMSWCGECNGLSYCMIHMDAAIYVIGNIYDNPELLLEAHA